MLDPFTIGFAILAAVAVVTIGLSLIEDWFEEKKTLNSKYGQLIKEKLASGDHRVIAGVFNKNGTCTAKKAWEGELDDDLKAKFGNRKKIRVTL